MNYDTKYSTKCPIKGPIKGELAKDKNNTILTGVCAGIAKHYEIRRFVLRIITIMCFLSFPKIIALTYIGAALILPKQK